MATRMIIMLLIVGLVLGGVIGFEMFLRPGLIRAAIAKGGRLRSEPRDGRKLDDRPVRLCGFLRARAFPRR